MHEAVVASYGQIAFYKSVLQFPLPKKGFIVNASKYSLSGTIQVLRHQRGGRVGSENGNF